MIGESIGELKFDPNLSIASLKDASLNAD